MQRKIIFIIISIMICSVCCYSQKRKKIDRTAMVRSTQKTHPKVSSSSENGNANKSKVVATNPPKKLKQSVRSTSKKSYFSISSQYVSFGADGGNRTFTVLSSAAWKISVNTENWGHLSRSGNTLYLRIDANNSSSSRADYFIISSGSKSIRVDISQGKGNSLTVSSEFLSFASFGGSQTITVNSSSPWKIGISTYSWGHLTTAGNSVTVSLDANVSAESRTDYFTVVSGNKSLKINIRQEGKNYKMYGTSRSFIDNATGLTYLTKNLKETNSCQHGAITERIGIYIKGDYGYCYTAGMNTNFIEKIKELNQKEIKITSVAITNSGYYCLIYGNNGWFGSVPAAMSARLNEFNANRETIYSISISENGDFAIVTNEHFYASNSTDHDNMIKAKDMFGQIKDVCITNKGITVVCQNGIYYHNIPTSVEERLKTCTERPDHIRFTDSGTFLISYENGIGYRYYM